MEFPVNVSCCANSVATFPLPPSPPKHKIAILSDGRLEVGEGYRLMVGEESMSSFVMDFVFNGKERGGLRRGALR